jgi:hypothetical protein
VIVGSVVQQPNDRLDYDFDLTGLFAGDTDELDSVTVTASPVGLTVTAVVAGATRAKVWVSDGVDGVEYIIQVRMTSVNGRVKEDELIIEIEEF